MSQTKKPVENLYDQSKAEGRFLNYEIFPSALLISSFPEV